MHQLYLSLLRSVVALVLCTLIVNDCYSAPATDSSSEVKPKLPNILWITSEDNSFQWLGCYGNQDAQTPRLDALAENSIKFTQAYSNAPVCAVARATILTGVYSTTLGTQHMRSRHALPKTIRPHVSYLRELGYYCTNDSKTDYNIEGNDKVIWDQCNRKAHYKNRKEDSPFFAIFNLTTSHESSLFPANVEKKRQQGIIPKETRLDPAKLSLPPYLPDLPEMRSDFAIYHDVMTALDSQIGDLLDELEAEGLADDTVIFYYGDHGGPTPRGKRFLTDTGVRIPLLIHVPKKWRHLTSFQQGESVDEIVSFVDLTPTLLSLCCLEVPEHMTGRAFMGANRVEPAEQQSVFLYADRFDELYGMRRGFADGRYKYIRRFTPHLPAAAYSFYPYGMPSWVAWRQAWSEGKLSGHLNDLWEPNQSVEMLFDTKNDPWEIKNLADDPKQAERLASMRNRMKMLMVEARDTGLIPEPMFESLAAEKTLYDYAQSERYDVNRYAEFAFIASSRNVENLSLLIEAFTDEDPIIRYWAALGCLILGEEAEAGRAELSALLEDEIATVRIIAAQALIAIDNSQQGITCLLEELDRPSNGETQLLLVNTITQVGIEDQVPDAWIEKVLADEESHKYVVRFVNKLKLDR